MRIAIVGYGKMGQAVKATAAAAGHEVVAVVDPEASEATAKEISAGNLNRAEVAIDFTHPDTVLDNIQKLAETKVQIVVGTTGWYDSLPEVEKIVKDAGIGLLYAGNFSIGVNAFYGLVAEAARKLTGKEFDVSIHETHHTAKVDAPSGTARELANIVIENFPEKKEISTDDTEQPSPEALRISSSREGKVVGIHEVTFDGASDTITLTHSGKNRDGYAQGAVLAAEFLQGKKGVFTAKDLF
ncbi:MAG: 4-hydroxy-tetrahydrodipicolinate reductase [Patescibacteria group bacterium]